MQVLSATKSLTALNLSRNHFGTRGATALESALEDNQSLTVLDVSRNALGFRCVLVHCACIRTTNTLQTCWCSHYVVHSMIYVQTVTAMIVTDGSKKWCLLLVLLTA
jgi:Leucine Rich repeat